MTATDVTPPDTAKSLRVRLGLTQEEAARLAPVSVRTLSTAERGEPVGLRTVDKVARVLGVSASEYVGGIEAERERRKSAKWFRLHSKLRRSR